MPRANPAYAETSAVAPRAIRPFPENPPTPYPTLMNTAHAPARKPARRTPGGQRGNQNARKHGRYSMLTPADRYAPLQKVLRSYGLKDPTPGGLTIEQLVDDPTTNMRLLFHLLQTTIELFKVRERLRRQ